MTDVSLKEHIEAQIRWVYRYFETQIKTIQEKTNDARVQIDKRLEGMNEFRDALKDQTARLITRNELERTEESTDRRLKVLEVWKSNFEGRVAIISIVVSVVSSGIIVLISRLLTPS